MRKRSPIIVCSTIFAVVVIVLAGIVILFSAKKNFEPKIKYAEFPFSLTYKIDDNIITINNTYVCEFKGIGWDTGRGFYRKWTGYVKETGLENVLIVEDPERQIFCQVGDPRYYMEDPDDLPWSIKSLSPPHLYAVKKSNNFDYISVEQIKQIYNIEIVSWNFSQPIETRSSN